MFRHAYRIPIALTALAFVAGSAVRAQGIELLSSVRQSGPAVTYNANTGDFLVVGQHNPRLSAHNDRLSARTVRRADDGTAVLGDVERLIKASGSDPAVAFSATADLYLVTAIQCRSFGVLVRPEGQPVVLRRIGFSLGIGLPGCDTRAVRTLYLPSLERWVVLAKVADRAIDGALVAADGTITVMARELFRAIEFADVGDFGLAAHPDDRGFLLVWGRAGALFGQRIEPDASTVGAKLTLAEGVDHRNVTVARAGSPGRYLMVWERSQRIWARMIEGDGLAPVVEISDGPGEAFLPALAYDSGGDSFVVTWTQRDLDEDLRARWLDGAGHPVQPSFPVASGPGNQLTFDHNSVSCADRTSECLVTWNHGESGRPASSIRGRFLERP